MSSTFIKVGSRVKLKGQGVWMTVIFCTGSQVTCAWYNSKGNLKTVLLPKEALNEVS